MRLAGNQINGSDQPWLGAARVVISYLKDIIIVAHPRLPTDVLMPVRFPNTTKIKPIGSGLVNQRSRAAMVDEERVIERWFGWLGVPGENPFRPTLPYYPSVRVFF